MAPIAGGAMGAEDDRRVRQPSAYSTRGRFVPHMGDKFVKKCHACSGPLYSTSGTAVTRGPIACVDRRVSGASVSDWGLRMAIDFPHVCTFSLEKGVCEVRGLRTPRAWRFLRGDPVARSRNGRTARHRSSPGCTSWVSRTTPRSAPVRPVSIRADACAVNPVGATPRRCHAGLSTVGAGNRHLTKGATHGTHGRCKAQHGEGRR